MHRALFVVSWMLSFLIVTPASARVPTNSVLEIKPGRRVRIERLDTSRIEGDLVRATADSLSVRSDSTLISIAMPSIGGVYERRRSAAVGAGIGAAVGALVGVVGGIAWSNSDSFIKPDSEAQGSAILGLVGVVVGAGFGAIVGSAMHRWKVRYRAAPETPGSP